MRYSKLFGKTIKKVSGDVAAKSHELLLRGGFIHQEMAGVFTFLPLGKRVLDKVDKIIKEEIDKIGGQEITMPALQPKESWLKTKRWDTVDVLFKVKSKSDKEYALGPTHEEIVTPLVKNYLQSYRDLPIFLYQIQTKFRDEPRAKSGIIRGREFGMKDLYSFHTTHNDLLSYYEKVKQAYLKVFSRLNLEVKITEASGGSFTKKYSHEFMVVSDAGEDAIIYCPVCNFCQNKEIAGSLKAGDSCLKCGKTLAGATAIEVGNIFDLGTKFSEDFDLYFTAKDGSRQPIVMGCYGIGDTRLVGAIVEVNHDQKGIVWPEDIAPYNVHLIKLNAQNQESRIKNQGKKTIDINKIAEEIYEKLIKNDVEVLYDDRKEVSAGEKLADCDLIGIPTRIIVSERTLEKGMMEVKKRDEEKAELKEIKEIYQKKTFSDVF